MSEDLTDFTPPVTPPLVTDKYFDDSDGSGTVDNLNIDSLSKRFSFRWFSCCGEVTQELNQNDHSILCAGEESIFDLSAAGAVRWLLKKNDIKSPIQLFGYNFDKGSALLCNIELLFKFARSKLMTLDSVVNTYGKFGDIKPSKELTRPEELRKHLVQFFLYIREYLYHLYFSNEENYRDILKHLKQILSVKLYSFRCLMRRIVDLPDYIYQHAAASQGRTSVLSGYHVFHCHLDLSWFHLTLLLLLEDNHNEVQDNRNVLFPGLSSVLNSSQLVGSDVTQFYINFLISDLVQLAIRRYEQICVKNLLNCSPFNCSCVREIWLLLQLLLELRERELRTEDFWSVVNKILNSVLDFENSEPSSIKEVETLKLPDCYTCSNPFLFTTWFISHLSPLYKYNNRELKSNYKLLERILKEVLKVDVSETLLQLYIPLIHNLCLNIWEPKSEPIILLWDYFQRRLNNTFYLPGAPLDKMAIISNTPLGLITQVHSRLSGKKAENSYEQFLQLLGLFIKKTEANPKHWNQLKGRIYSKFPASKILGLNETGLYHFISLFITMAVARNDIAEVCKKLQEFLLLIGNHQLDPNRKKLVWQTHLTVLLLLIERNEDLTQAIIPLLHSVKILDFENNLPLMKMFVKGLQDAVDCNSSVNLGLFTFVDDWIPRYLAVCPEADASILMNTILSIIKILKTKQKSLKPEEIEFFKRLWICIKPFVEKVGKSSNECLLEIADIAAELAIISIEVSHVGLRFREMITVFTSNETIDVRILRRFIYHLIHCEWLKMALPNHNTVIIQLWIRCSLLSIDSRHLELTKLSQYVTSLPEVKMLETVETSEPLICFFCGLKNEYDNLQSVKEKGEMHDRVVRYFDSMKQWLQHSIRTPESPDLIERIYTIIGQMIKHIGSLIYIKSHPMTVLQMLTDLLLLPMSVRKPDYKLHPNISSSIKSTLYLYIEGLVKLDIKNDNYICRTAQELLVIYLPRCLSSPGEQNAGRFSLVKCFNNQSEYGFTVAKFILETITNKFLSRTRSRNPPPSCGQALQFLKDLLLVHGCNSYILSLMLLHCLENVCCVIMYCEDRNQCKKDASYIILQILESQLIRQDNSLSEDLMAMFSRLCREHLAFSARQLFSLFNTMSDSSPDLIYRFLPQLLKHIKEVESKRAVGYDRALRAEYENLEKTLNNLKR
ncbi:protein MMS22-like [Lycorma delicatula]|uniref:protein MMS22-like n=1 Tax=Lycorma delicatula TaxID=130591 RepID=UPI003F513274